MQHVSRRTGYGNLSKFNQIQSNSNQFNSIQFRFIDKSTDQNSPKSET